MNTTDNAAWLEAHTAAWERLHAPDRRNPAELERLFCAILDAMKACNDWQERQEDECDCTMCQEVAGIRYNLNHARAFLHGQLLTGGPNR